MIDSSTLSSKFVIVPVCVSIRDSVGGRLPGPYRSSRPSMGGGSAAPLGRLFYVCVCFSSHLAEAPPSIDLPAVPSGGGRVLVVAVIYLLSATRLFAQRPHVWTLAVIYPTPLFLFFSFTCTAVPSHRLLTRASVFDMHLFLGRTPVPSPFEVVNPI